MSKIELPKGWKQLDHDDEEHIFVHVTDAGGDAHYYDKSVEVVKEGKSGMEWGVYARTGRDRDTKQIFHQIFQVKSEAELKIRQLMEKGF